MRAFRQQIAAMALLLLAACSGSEPLPPASFEDPVLGANGQLTGLVGVDGRHWKLVESDLRQGLYWHTVLAAMSQRCIEVFPEHKGWLTELYGLLRRAHEKPLDHALVLEAARLKDMPPGADRALVALQAMRAAKVDFTAIAKAWIKQATGQELPEKGARVQACSMLFDRTTLRDMMRRASRPLASYLEDMQDAQPELSAALPGIDVMVRRLKSI